MDEKRLDKEIEAKKKGIELEKRFESFLADLVRMEESEDKYELIYFCILELVVTFGDNIFEILGLLEEMKHFLLKEWDEFSSQEDLSSESNSEEDEDLN